MVIELEAPLRRARSRKHPRLFQVASLAMLTVPAMQVLVRGRLGERERCECFSLLGLPMT
jgi:hypothetical protein